MTSFFRLFLSAFFPAPCVSCGYLGEALCLRCRDRLGFFPHVRRFTELQVASALYFKKGDLLEELIHPLKYAHQASVARFLVPPMLQALRLLLEPSQVILVPVPLHPRRELERGYNQAELLARQLGQAIGAPVLPLLQRVRETESQVHVGSRAARLNNLEGVFAVKGPLPKVGQIVLVDDIVTTGSTLLACAQTLRAAGVTDLAALTLADRNEAPSPPWN